MQKFLENNISENYRDVKKRELNNFNKYSCHMSIEMFQFNSSSDRFQKILVTLMRNKGKAPTNIFKGWNRGKKGYGTLT